MKIEQKISLALLRNGVTVKSFIFVGIKFCGFSYEIHFFVGQLNLLFSRIHKHEHNLKVVIVSS